MKTRTLNKLSLSSLLISLLLIITSCNYLDVAPPEQEKLADALKDEVSTRGFLQSCYSGVYDVFRAQAIESSVDEYILSRARNVDVSAFVSYNLFVPTFENWSDYDTKRWANGYFYIQQCNLFLENLPQAKNVSQSLKKQWSAEARVLRAYYHFMLLNLFGPIPISDRVYPQTTPSSDFPGRYHYDYVVNWIVNEIDESMSDLLEWQRGEHWGQMSQTIAKAIKGRCLLYAASDLWNGKFPNQSWENRNFETPGYGKKLVSFTYDKGKWEQALKACEDALSFAINNAGRSLVDTAVSNELYKRYEMELPYYPGLDERSGKSKEEIKVLKEKIGALRYAVASRETDGNRETIWGIREYAWTWFDMVLPHFMQKRSNGSWCSYYQSAAASMYTVEHFYTLNGKIPAEDREFPEEDWFRTANLPDRLDIINLNTLREPRFYAWFAFDGGDHAVRVYRNGRFIYLPIDMKDPTQQGYNTKEFALNNNETGYLIQKFVWPEAKLNSEAKFEGATQKPRPLIRLAELYLNLAECQAMLGLEEQSLVNINKIRSRAGIPELSRQDLSSRSLIEWIRNERFVELWGEGHRYYDLRRWGIAKEYLKAGTREGLNALVNRPSFEEFNHKITINQPYEWDNRMLLMPIFIDELYKNPQLVQAPGYE